MDLVLGAVVGAEEEEGWVGLGARAGLVVLMTLTAEGEAVGVERRRE